MNLKISSYPNRSCRSLCLGLLFLFTALTVVDGRLAVSNNKLQQIGQAEVAPTLAWDNDDDPDEGGQLA